MAKSKEEITKLTKLREQFTDTTTFLLPSLGISLETLFKLGFINCYLRDKNREKINEKDVPLYLLFKPDEKQVHALTETIERFEEQEDLQNFYLDDYDYEGGYIVIVLKFPQRFIKDYNRFLEGKYSHFSQGFCKSYSRNVQVTFLNEKGEIEAITGDSLAWMVVNKDEKIKKYQEKKYDISLDEADEYYSIYKIERETLDIDKINNI